jgi:Flp pilus assembly protein TadD
MIPTATPVPAVATAFAAVNENPGDPKTQLELALAYWDAGQMHDALLTLDQAANAAGRTNTQFYQEAGDQFRQRQAWIAATAMYVRAIKSLGPGGKPADDLRTSFHESLYKASPEADLPTYLQFGDLELVEQPIALVAQGRYSYYNGDTAKAHQLLKQVMTMRPHMAEASLLQAEMDANEGKTFQAKQTLLILVADLATPEWVREMAQSLSNKIP